MDIAMLQIVEGIDGTPQIENNKYERIPDDWNRAQGWEVGYYAIDIEEGDIGNAWAWSGPYKTEAEAMALTNWNPIRGKKS